MKEFCFRNKYLNIELLYQKLIEDYPDIKITLNPKEKKQLIEKYKKAHNLTEEELEDLDFNDI